MTIADKANGSLPLVSVVILNYNGLKYLGKGLQECLDSIIQTEYPNLEVTFVDNGSTDQSITFSARGVLKMIRNPNSKEVSEFNS